MGQRGALIVVPRASALAAEGSRRDRFGAQTLLEQLVRDVCHGVEHIVIVPMGAPLAQEARDKLGAAVTVAEPCAEADIPLNALGRADGLFPPSVETVAVLTADLPYLNSGHLEELYGALRAEAQGVCVVDGEERQPMLGVYRREVLVRARGINSGTDAEGAAIWQGLRMHEISAPTVSGRAPGRAQGGLPGGAQGQTVDGQTIASRLDSPEAYRKALTHHGFCDAAHPAITLELYGNLRIRTGCGTLPIRADQVGTAFRVFRGVYPEASRWLPENDTLPEHFRFSINGSEVTNQIDQLLAENDQLILFSATVGG